MNTTIERFWTVVSSKVTGMVELQRKYKTDIFF